MILDNQVEAGSEVERPPALSGLDYQAFWTIGESKNWLRQALGEAASWARERLDLEIDLTQDSEVTGSDGTKRAQVLHRHAGRDTGVRLRVWNTNAGTTFTVTVLAVDGPGGGWLLIQASSSDRSRRTEKPAVADRILSIVDLADVRPMRTAAQHFTDHDLDDLEQLINNPVRRFPVIVAAPIDGIEFDRWNQAVSKWTRYCAGIAHIISLDPNSASGFRKRHGGRGVQQATLRTYPPGVDLDNPGVEQTARWLTPNVLSGSERKVARLIESFIRQHQITHPVPLPSAVREWSRAFDRFAAQELRLAVRPATATLQERLAARQAALKPKVEVVGPAVQRDGIIQTRVHDPERIEGLVEADATIASLFARLEASERARIVTSTQLQHVQEFLSLSNLEDESLLELLDAATQTQPDSSAIAQLLNDNDQLRNNVEELEDRLIEEQISSSDLSAELDQLEVYYQERTRENSFLRSKIVEHDPASAYAWTDEGGPSNPLGECPIAWDSLLTDSRLFNYGLSITGNPRRTKEISSLDLDGSGLRAAWASLGTLASYRANRLAGTWETNVHSFCEAGPAAAFHVPPNKHAQDETSATRKDKRLADHRLLPVPKSVDGSGYVQMWAHFKPYSWSAHQKLRIHYYDQVTTDGRIYIGHIGYHLPSGSTDKVRR